MNGGWIAGDHDWASLTPSLGPSVSLALCIEWDGDFTIHVFVSRTGSNSLMIFAGSALLAGVHVYMYVIWQSV